MKQNFPILDLHGVPHSEVVDKLHNFYFWENHSDSIIITGKSDTMKKIVIDWLEDNDYIYNVSFSNPGRINVSL